MRRIVATTLIAVVMTAGLAGCGTKERDELRARVTSLEAELTKTKMDLQAKTGTLEQMQQSALREKQRADELAAENAQLKANAEQTASRAKSTKKKR